MRIEHKGRTHSWHLPNFWNELTTKQLLWICPRLKGFRQKYREYDELTKGKHTELASYADQELQAIRITILKKICGIGRWPFSRKNRAFYAMAPEQLADILLELNFIFVAMDRTKPVMDSFRYKRTTYYGPGDEMKNLTGAEFHFLDRLYQQYLESGQEKYLNAMVAILYRPQGITDVHDPQHEDFAGDIRRRFNRHQVEKDAEHLAGLSKGHKAAIFFWWQCFRQELQNRRKDVFSQGNKKQAQNSGGWIPVFRSLARHPIHFESIANMRLSEILRELALAKREADAERKRLQQLKAKRK